MPPLHAPIGLLIAFLSVAVGLAPAEMFSPVVTGRVVDTPLQDGVGDSTSAGPLVANVNGSQHRTVHEFDLTSLVGQTVLSASLTGQVVPNNSADTGERGHGFSSYLGDGVLGVDDYNLSGDLLGSVTHPSGGTSDFNFDVSGAVGALLSGSGGYFGVRTDPINEPQGFDVVTDVELNIETLPAGLTIRSISPTVDAQGFIGDSIAGIQDGANSLLAYDRTTGSDDRAVMEFGLGAIPSNAEVNRAWLDIDIFSFTSGSTTPGPAMRVYGYAGDGFADPSDVDRTGNLLAIGDPVQNPGAYRIFLDPANVQSILAGGASHLGLLGVGDPNHNQLQFWSSEAASFADPPRLSVAYSVPATPNADYNGDGLIDAADYTVWRDNFGSTTNLDADGDGSGEVAQPDYDLWAAQYGAVATPPGITNPDFETGDLTGWTEAVTPNGAQGSGYPRVESFDVDGDGEASLAYRTQVGQVATDINTPAGAGISQEFTIGEAGDYLLSVDFAAQNLGFGSNAGPGRFELWFDGVLVDVVDLNEGPGIGGNQTLRDTLSASLAGVTAGPHDLEVLILRPFTLGAAIYQYLDDFSLVRVDASLAAPEPAAAVLTAFGILTALRRRCSLST